MRFIDDKPVGQLFVGGVCRVGGNDRLGSALVVPCPNLFAEALGELLASRTVADCSKFGSAFGAAAMLAAPEQYPRAAAWRCRSSTWGPA